MNTRTVLQLTKLRGCLDNEGKHQLYTAEDVTVCNDCNIVIDVKFIDENAMTIEQCITKATGIVGPLHIDECPYCTVRESMIRVALSQSATFIESAIRAVADAMDSIENYSPEFYPEPLREVVSGELVSLSEVQTILVAVKSELNKFSAGEEQSENGTEPPIQGRVYNADELDNVADAMWEDYNGRAPCAE